MLQTIRSIIFFTLMIITIPPWVLIAFFTLLLPVNTAMRIVSGWAHTIVWLLRVICGLKHEVTGLENLPKDEKVVFAAKHQSAWETIAFQTFLPPAAWVLKKELLWIPIFGWGLACIKPISIDRGQKKRAIISVIEQGVKAFKDNRNVMIFPEGTRTTYGDTPNYKQGGTMLAMRAGARIVPVAHNAGKYWRRQGLTKYPGTIKVAIGKPIDTEGRDITEITNQIQEWIEGQIQEWKDTE